MKRSYMLIFSLLCSFNYALGCGLCGSGPESERPSFPRLTEAVIDNDQKQVEALLAQGESVNGKDQIGLTPLMHAAALGNQLLAKLLLDKGADIHALDRNECTCLFYAIHTNKKEMVQFLLDNGAHIHAEGLACSDKYSLTPIAFAVSLGDRELVQLLLDNGGILGQKELFFAAFLGCSVMIELMLDLVKDIDINAKDINTKEGRGSGLPVPETDSLDGDTCLWYAVMSGDKNTVRLLIERGANRYDRSDDPYVDRILFDRNYALLPLFLMSKEELAIFESEGRISDEVALILAIAENNKEKVELILDKGIDINRKDNEYGYTYLHYAALSGNKKMVQLLIDRGADKEATCKEGLTYHIYLEYGPPPLPQINAENGYYTELEHQKRDETALILAIAENNKEKVELILNRGIDINKKDNEYGYTYLHYAALSGNQEMVQLLINRGADKEATCKKGLNYQTYLEYGPPPLNEENGYYTELEHQQRVLKGK